MAGGYAPFHAVALLRDLGAREAIEPMFRFDPAKNGLGSGFRHVREQLPAGHRDATCGQRLPTPSFSARVRKGAWPYSGNAVHMSAYKCK